MKRFKCPSDNLKLSVGAQLNRNNCILCPDSLCIFWVPEGPSQHGRKALSFKCCPPSRSWGAGCLLLFRCSQLARPELEALSLVPLNSVFPLYHLLSCVPLLCFLLPASQHSARPMLAFVLIFYCFIKNCHKKKPSSWKQYMFITCWFSWVRGKGMLCWVLSSRV